MIFQKHILDTPRRKIVAYSFVLYYPIMSLLVSAPIPFPSLFEISPEQIALFNFISLLVTIIGSSVGIYFSLDKKSVSRFDVQNKKIDKLDEKIEETAIAHHEELKELKNEMKEMEKRICASNDQRILDLEKNTDLKVSRAKEIVDEKFKHNDEVHSDHLRRIDRMEHSYYSKKDNEI